MGDRLNVFCRYDMSRSDSTITGGDATDDEMCIVFLAFYPKPRDLHKDPRITRCFSDTTCSGGAESCGVQGNQILGT